MKKFVLFLICLILPCTFLCSCKSQNNLDGFVSELRSNCYKSVDSNLTIKAGYGFIEQQPNLDGKVGEKIYVLKFKLTGGQTENVTYHVSLNFNQTEYFSTFKLNPISHSLTAIMQIDNFNLSQFEITIKYGSDSQTVKMQSILPENTITYSNALSCLQQSQSQLLKTFYQDGKFCAELCLRVLVKDNHPYWYVCISSKEISKALLIDGFTGEVLAIRDVF